jgi:hypothetical protein
MSGVIAFNEAVHHLPNLGPVRGFVRGGHFTAVGPFLCLRE